MIAVDTSALIAILFAEQGRRPSRTGWLPNQLAYRRSVCRKLPWFWLGGSVFERLPVWVTNGLGVNFYFGGTSLLIVVGVAMDTVTQVEAQLIMRHYDGFTPRSGRIRGRRNWS